jgi:hypothetical protein
MFYPMNPHKKFLSHENRYKKDSLSVVFSERITEEKRNPG